MSPPPTDVLLLRASGADSEPEGWEVVSSSSEGGEGGERSAARAAEEAALATSFLLGELSPPASPPSEGAAGEAGPGPSSGSEAGEHGSGGATAAVELAEGQALAPCSPLLEAAAACGAMLPQQPGTPSQGMRPMGLRPSAPGQAKGAGADGSGGGGDASAAGLPRAESVYLLVVRSDEQEGLQAAVAALEKRCGWGGMRDEGRACWLRLAALPRCGLLPPGTESAGTCLHRAALQGRPA